MPLATKTLGLIGTVAAGVLLGASLLASSAEGPYGTRDRPLEGQRYETLRALANHLDQTTRGALEGAADEAHRGASSSEEDRFLSSIRAFARGAEAFHRSVDGYRTSAFEVPAQVDALTTQARQVNDRIRAARALGNSYADWDAILDVLDRMSLLLAGRDVEVPAAHVVAALSGPRLQEFRQLARELDASATQAHERAKRDVGEYRDRGQQFLGELYYFEVQSRELHGRADAAQINPQQIGPAVDRLLEEARLADRRMRDARVFTSVWDDSGRTITLLRRMAGLVRS
jgi:hypothetical protein